MQQKTIVSLLVILATLALAGYFIYPSVIYYSKSPRERLEYVKTNPKILRKIFNLGLDLQGGMRLVLEIDRSKLDKKEDRDVLDRAYTIIENRINGLGVAEPSIQKQGKERLIVELPGLKDKEAAKGVIGRTTMLEFNLLREPAQLERAVKTIDNVLKGQTTKDTTNKADTATIKKKENQSMAERLFTGADTSAKVKDTGAAKAAATDTSAAGKLLAGVTSFRDLLVRVGDQIGASVENKAKVDAIMNRNNVRAALEGAGLGDNAFFWAHDTSIVNNTVFRILYYVKGHPEMRGDVIKDARASIDQSGMHGGAAKVDLELNSKGARRFSQVTGANVGKFMAIVLDSSVYTAPRIIQKISQGRAEITGNFSMEEAKNLSVVLRAGALPAPVSIIEERTVGPSLGDDSIRAGVIAGIIGIGLIILIMVGYYHMGGFYAIFAMFLTLIMVLAVMASINSTLTLPGIAGLILNLGMAVDANVLILERIREELALGKTIRSAIEAGYNRAFITIMDANLTTLLTAFVLLWLGTGPIKGFAVTLILGLIISLYTAVFITHVMYNIFTPKNATKLSV